MLGPRGIDGELVGRGTGPVGQKARRHLISRPKVRLRVMQPSSATAQDASPHSLNRVVVSTGLTTSTPATC